MSYYPNPAPNPASNQPPSSGLRPGDVPKPFWAAGIVAALGFFVHAYFSQITSGSGGYSCHYTDFGALAVAAAVVLCVGAGWLSRLGRPVGRRLATPLMLAITVLLLVLAAVHVARGLGVVSNPCDAHPLP